MLKIRNEHVSQTLATNFGGNVDVFFNPFIGVDEVFFRNSSCVTFAFTCQNNTMSFQSIAIKAFSESVRDWLPVEFLGDESGICAEIVMERDS